MNSQRKVVLTHQLQKTLRAYSKYLRDVTGSSEWDTKPYSSTMNILPKMPTALTHLWLGNTQLDN